MSVELIEEGVYDVASFDDELAAAPLNRAVGTVYFWTCVDVGVGRQRYADGMQKVLRYGAGDTTYSEHSPERRC